MVLSNIFEPLVNKDLSKRIIDHHGGQAAIDRLCAMPITQDEALELAGKWDNEKVRNETINHWLRFARDKYAAAAAMAAK